MSDKKRPLDSGRKDALGRTVRVSGDAVDGRADAPAPDVTDEVSSAAARRGVLLGDKMLGYPDVDGMDPDDAVYLAQDAITNLMHWADAHGANVEAMVFSAEEHFESERGAGDDLSNDPWQEEQIAALESEREATAGQVSVSRDELAEMLRELDNMTTDSFANGGDRAIRDRLVGMLGIDRGGYESGDFEYGAADDGQFEKARVEIAALDEIGWKAKGFRGWHEGNPMLLFETDEGVVVTRRQDYGDYSTVEFAWDTGDDRLHWEEDNEEFGLSEDDRENVFDDAVWNLEASVARAVNGSPSVTQSITDREAAVRRWFG